MNTLAKLSNCFPDPNGSLKKTSLLVFVLLLTTLLVGGNVTFASPGAALEPQCDPVGYYGVQHCIGNNGAVHTIVVDLNDPHVHFQTVLPEGPNGECNSVNPDDRDQSSNCPYPYPFETIDDMLRRYKAGGAVAIINTDYFGCGGKYPCGSPHGDHGAQGLAVRNGVRLDGPQHDTTDNLAYTQPSLAISPSNVATLGIPESEAAIEAHLSTTYYNTVSGAPIIVSGGQIVNANCTRPYPGDTCSRTSQSAAGLTSDGRLVLITAKKDATGVASFLVTNYRVHTALKFDGGGSARLAWLDNKGEVQTFGSLRPVAEGLLVFSTPLPEYDAALADQSNFVILDPNQSTTLYIELKNTGRQDWMRGQDIQLVRARNDALGAKSPLDLPKNVPPGQTGRWEFAITAPGRAGLYQTTWQLKRGSDAVGQAVTVNVIVLPPEAKELREKLERKIEEWRKQGEQKIEELIAEITREIQKYVEREVEKGIKSICSTSAVVLVLACAVWLSRRG